MSLMPIPFAFIHERTHLSWRDALWGYEHQMLGWTSIVELAKHRAILGLDPRELDLSLLGKEEVHKIGDLLRDLAKNESDKPNLTTKNIWLYLMLSWTFFNKERIADPLGQVETIYADFDYPQEIEGFVRYMPVTDGYDPSAHSADENQKRLFSNWECYLRISGHKLELND